MKKYLLVLFISAFFLLGACTGAEQVTISETPEPNTDSQPVDTTSEEEEPTEADLVEVEPTEAAVEDSGGVVPVPGIQMECTVVSDQPDTPAEFVEIFGVKESDWVEGPDTAAVTFVEYGDFQ